MEHSLRVDAIQWTCIKLSSFELEDAEQTISILDKDNSIFNNNI